MPKSKKEQDVTVRVSVDTTQVEQLSRAVELFVDGLAIDVRNFAEDIADVVDRLAVGVADTCSLFRESLPGQEPRVPVDDLPQCTSDCPDKYGCCNTEDI